MLIVGIEQKQGEYEGQYYHNLVFHCTMPTEKKDSVGQVTKAVKVKASRLEECFGRQIYLEEVMALVGSKVSFNYDEYKNVNLIRVFEEKNNKKGA